MPAGALDALPTVTVQLPIYNEMYVADRLIDAVCQIDYPRELLEIQVLDDSTDETRSVAERAVRRNAAQGHRHHLHPPHRSHRLQGGRARSGHEGGQGRVHRDLRRRLHPDRPTSCGAPFRSSPTRRWRWCRRAGATSTRTTRCSRRSSRSCSTATSCSSTAAATAPASSSTSTAPPASGAATAIVDAGGWQHDTLTEDLDLSYRAQLRGWKFVFLPDLVAPAEVPVEMNSFKSQQHRWAKGSIQTCRKLLPRILRSNLPLAREGRGVLPPHRQLQLPAHVRAVGADGAVDGHPLQHGLVRDAAHRRAAVLRGDGVGGQLLHGVPARAAHGLDHAAEVPAVPDVDRHRPRRQQHARRCSRRCSTSRASSPARRSTASRRQPTSGSARSTARASSSSR